MNRLMICVERAVRPVRAEENTKCNMREELYAHIVSIFQEEHEWTGDENMAITNALCRFGELSDLTTELQATVSPI